MLSIRMLRCLCQRYTRTITKTFWTLVFKSLLTRSPAENVKSLESTSLVTFSHFGSKLRTYPLCWVEDSTWLLLRLKRLVLTRMCLISFSTETKRLWTSHPHACKCLVSPLISCTKNRSTMMFRAFYLSFSKETHNNIKIRPVLWSITTSLRLSKWVIQRRINKIWEMIKTKRMKKMIWMMA